MFAGKAGAYPMPTKIRPLWENLPGTDNLAYYEHLQITEVKSFIRLSFGPNVIKLFGRNF